MDDSETPITDAIADRLRADGINAMVTGYILIAEYIDDDGDSSWFTSYPDAQSLTTSIGQAEWLSIMLRKNADRYFAAIDIDEDDE